MFKKVAVILFAICAVTQAATATNATATNATAKFKPTDAIKVVAGLMDGVIKSNDTIALNTCMANADNIQVGIIKIVKDLKKGSTGGAI